MRLAAWYDAPQEADEDVYKNIDPKSSELYRLANQFRKENADVVGDKPVKNDVGEMSMNDDSKWKAWLEHYQRLLNAEFDRDPNHLSDESPVEGSPIPITIDMLKKAISHMKAGRVPGPSGIVVEMIRAAGDMGASVIPDLAAAIIRDGKVPSRMIAAARSGKGARLEGGPLLWIWRLYLHVNKKFDDDDDDDDDKNTQTNTRLISMEIYV